MFNKGGGLARFDDAAGLARAYAWALSHDAVNGNGWGLPGELEGQVSEHMLTLGQPAAEALKPLLDDPTELMYEGSEEATIGGDYGYRVKDIAAYLVSRVLGREFTPARSADERDRTIDALRSEIGG